MFTIVNAVVLHPIHVARLDQLVAIYRRDATSPFGGFSLNNYRAITKPGSSLSAMAAQTAVRLPLDDGAQEQAVNVSFVSDNYFEVLGVRPQRGRLDDKSAAVLSFAFWKSHFGADSAVLGKVLRVHGRALVVAGVAGEGFDGSSLDVSSTDIWVAISNLQNLNTSLSYFGPIEDVPVFTIIGRLTPGSSAAAAADELNALVERLADAGSPPRPWNVFIGPLTPAITVLPLAEAAASVRDRGTLTRFLRILGMVVVLALAVACVNVARLMNVRAAERSRELRVRVALGATTGRLIRQLLTETTLLALAGGLLGIALAFGGTRLIASQTLPGGVAVSRLQLDPSPGVLAFTLLVSIVTSLAIGLAPARVGTRLKRIIADDTDALADRSRRGNLLLGIQAAVTVVLLVSCGLLLRSLANAFRTDLGFESDAVAMVPVTPDFQTRHLDNVPIYQAIVASIARMPGVTRAAAGSHVPLGAVWRQPVQAVDAERPVTLVAGYASVSAEFFRTLGIPLVAGRSFSDNDAAGAPRVVILNETAARTLWPGQDAVGKQVSIFGGTLHTVIGVVRDTKYETLRDSAVPFVFAHLPQINFAGSLSFVVRSPDPASSLPGLYRIVTSLAHGMQVGRPRLVSDKVDFAMAPQRASLKLLGLFAGLALCISGVGIYGTVEYVVSRRTIEIGIRMALGARGLDILRLVLRETIIAVLAGLALGATATILGARLLAHTLGTPSFDWLALIGAAATLVLAATLAALIPAIRATRVDPAHAIMRLTQ